MSRSPAATWTPRRSAARPSRRRLDRRLPRSTRALSGALAGHARRHRARAARSGARARRAVRRIFADFERIDRPRAHALEPSGLLRVLRHHRQRARRARRVSRPRSTSRRCCGGRRRPRPSSRRSTLGWLRELMGLPPTFEGVIYDTASISTLHALAAAREAAVPDVRARGLRGPPTWHAVACTAPSRRTRRSTRR